MIVEDLAPAPVRRRAPLVALFAANGVSVCGTMMTFLAIPWFVLETTGSSTQTGLVAAVELIAVVASSALGGPMVARFGARGASVLSDLLAALAVLAIPVLHLTVGLALWQLVLLVAVLGISRAPGETARSTVVPELAKLGGTPLERAASAADGASRAAKMVGPMLAGVLIAVTGAAEVLFVDAATFLVSALLVGLFVPGVHPDDVPAKRGARAYLADLRAGVGYLRKDRLIGAITLMLMVTNLMDAAVYSVLLPRYAKDVLGSSVALGVVTGVFGGAALVGTVLYGWLGPRLPRWPVYTLAFLAVGAPKQLLLIAEPGMFTLVAGFVAIGLLCGAINPILTVVEYERIPEAQRPVVFGVTAAGCAAGMPVGTVLAGLSVDHLGLATTMWLTGGLYLVATLCPLVFRVWRQMDRIK
ncbi:MFS transporter [Crossiella sp. CA-258035]|uniref:MFS transporter n=1 Tax=Crossiella sp. CA-258035 TaxID=2981138 RepID=UPI0024BC7906|nr:MFS transporter [Crossiella sp. CA-258035]WHT16814.1 MFS transporter [Crossiella sp. CA-258035]